MAGDAARSAHRRRRPALRFRAVRASLARARESWALSLTFEDAHFRQRKAVELARVRGRVGAGVAEVDEIAFLEVRGQRLVAHDDVHGIAGRSAHRPGDVGAGAVGPDAVPEAFG